MNPDDKALLERVFTREPGQFEALLERYRGLIYSVFHGPTFDFTREDMDDLFQSFVVALSREDYRKLRAFEGRNDCSLATFLQIVATRFALDEVRKLRRQPRAYGQVQRDDDEASHETEDPAALPPDAPVLDQEQLDIFHNLLFSLEWKRVSAVLWVFKGVERERIAAVMATSRANIDALYKRAKDQMTELYQSGAGASRARRADLAVLVPSVRQRLTALLPVPAEDLLEALLVPGSKRQALLGLVLLDYPSYLCTRAELAKLSGSADPIPAIEHVLDALAGKLGRALA